jgi:hypothetical protein
LITDLLAPKLQSEEEIRRLVPKPLSLCIDRMAAGSKRETNFAAQKIVTASAKKNTSSP